MTSFGIAVVEIILICKISTMYVFLSTVKKLKTNF